VHAFSLCLLCLAAANLLFYSIFRTPVFLLLFLFLSPFRCGRVGAEILIKEIAVNPVNSKKKIYPHEDEQIASGNCNFCISLIYLCTVMLATQHF